MVGDGLLARTIAAAQAMGLRLGPPERLMSSRIQIPDLAEPAWKAKTMSYEAPRRETACCFRLSSQTAARLGRVERSPTGSLERQLSRSPGRSEFCVEWWRGSPYRDPAAGQSSTMRSAVKNAT